VKKDTLQIRIATINDIQSITKIYNEAIIKTTATFDTQTKTIDEQIQWFKDFDSWDICDQACTSLFDLSPFAWKKVFEWSERDEEFIKRGAFSLIAGLSVHDKNAINKKFEEFFPIIKKQSTDERNYVKKAVNWALRNIGKRNLLLNKKTIILSNDILKMESKTAKWIARNALKELTSIKIQDRLKKKQ